MGEDVLKACPFCNCRDITFTEIEDDGDEDLIFAFCLNCIGGGPYKHSKKKAIQAWNRRVYDENKKNRGELKMNDKKIEQQYPGDFIINLINQHTSQQVSIYAEKAKYIIDTEKMSITKIS